GREGAKQQVHEHDVHHRRFIDNEEVEVERATLVAMKAPARRIGFQQAMNRLGGAPGRFGQTLGSPACRSAETAAQIPGSEYLEVSAGERGLADAWTAGDDQHFLSGSLLDRLPLRIGEFKADLRLDAPEN